jgi:hypothetical protein
MVERIIGIKQLYVQSPATNRLVRDDDLSICAERNEMGPSTGHGRRRTATTTVVWKFRISSAAGKVMFSRCDLVLGVINVFIMRRRRWLLMLSVVVWCEWFTRCCRSN